MTLVFALLTFPPTPLPPIPPRLQTIPERVVSIAMEIGVPPALATQLASVESGMDPGARHKDRNGTSWGVMQLSDRYWGHMYCFHERWEDPCTAEAVIPLNIRAGLTYLRKQLDKCAKDRRFRHQIAIGHDFDWGCAVARYRGKQH